VPVEGVSTRRVGDIVRDWASRASAGPQVSVLAKTLDATVPGIRGGARWSKETVSVSGLRIDHLM
jgi:hypothetical protein